jgi:hypothetical protein
MSNRIQREHLDRPFDIGDLVHSKTLTYDATYTKEGVEERHKHDGEIGIVTDLHNAHGNSCTVEFFDGTACYNDEELVLFAPVREHNLALWREHQKNSLDPDKHISMQDAEVIALRWSAMQEEGTMHIRALRNLIRQQIGMERIPDNEPVTATP